MFTGSSLLPLIYETEGVAESEASFERVCEFLGLDPDFQVSQSEHRVHGSWTDTSVARWGRPWFAGASARSSSGGTSSGRFAKGLGHRFLRERYLPKRDSVARLSGGYLDCWDYVADLLAG